MPSGRLPYYSTPEEFSEAVDAYFEEMEETNTPITITGLILYLGFSHREALHDYEKKEPFSDIVKRARMKVENAYEMRLAGTTPTGSIFALKNMGWKDKTETALTGENGGPINIQYVAQQGNEPIPD